MDDETRIFGIGLNKTGTSSLKHALMALSIGPIPKPSEMGRASLVDDVLLRHDYERALRFAERYRAFEDRPWNIGEMYRRLHERFPNSLFVLTVRDEEGWWRSVERWVTVVKPWMKQRYQLHLGAEAFAREPMIEGYRRYNDAVRRYFAEHDPGRLLVMDMATGDGWEPLCAFLGLPVPDQPFPHKNRQGYRDLRPEERRARRVRPRVRLCHACGARVPPRRHRVSPRDAQGPAAPPGPIARAGGRLRRRITDARERSLARIARARYESPRWSALRARRAARRHPGLGIDDLAVVCCFFDTHGSDRRLHHYQAFNRHVRDAGVPLLTVELAFDDRPHRLGDDCGEVLRLRSRSMLWQKERLLNLGIQELLDRGYRKIAWLDADIRFVEPGWPWHLASALEEARLVQVFREIRVQRGGDAPLERGVSALKYLRDRGRLDGQRPRRPGAMRPGYPRGYSGFGWAARAEVLEKAQLYEGAVVGGGDKLIYLASLPRDERWEDAVTAWFRSATPTCPSCGFRGESSAWQHHYRAWADRWTEAVGGRTGFADTMIVDAYHGDRDGRRYGSRNDLLLREQFDPSKDLAIDADGLLAWASDKTEMHEDVREYFRLRGLDEAKS